MESMHSSAGHYQLSLAHTSRLSFREQHCHHSSINIVDHNPIGGRSGEEGMDCMRYNIS